MSFDFQRNSVDSKIDSVTLEGSQAWRSWYGSCPSFDFGSTFSLGCFGPVESFDQRQLLVVIVAFTIRSATATDPHFAHNFTIQALQ